MIQLAENKEILLRVILSMLTINFAGNLDRLYNAILNGFSYELFLQTIIAGVTIYKILTTNKNKKNGKDS